MKISDIERPKRDIKGINPIQDFKEVLKRGIAPRRWLLFISMHMFTWAIINTFRYPYAYEIKGANQFIIGGITTTMIITEAIFSVPLGRITDRIGRKKMFFLLSPIYSLANIVLIFAPSSSWLIFAGLLMGFRMLSYFAFGSMTPELVPRECVGRWRGIIGFVTGLVTIPAPIIGGYIWEHLGASWVLIIPTLIDLFVVLPLLYTVPETLNRKIPT
jgi:MFS family permease